MGSKHGRKGYDVTVEEKQDSPFDVEVLRDDEPEIDAAPCDALRDVLDRDI